ncbi:hypothetical protein G6F35_015791 [Rhizopus arrhizus]|nr:hypothetical protein G6F35_015791 [Rhizopus arrhizus]
MDNNAPLPAGDPGRRAGAGGRVRPAGHVRLAPLGGSAAGSQGPARPGRWPDAACLGRAHRRQQHRHPDPRHPGRQRLSESHRARPAPAVAGFGIGCLDAGQSGQRAPGRQWRDPRPDVPARQPRPAAPRPRGDRHRPDRHAVLRWHADDRPAARRRRVVAVAHGRRLRRHHCRAAVPQRRPAAAAPALQLGRRRG